MTPATVERLAAAFWDRAGGRPPPPRDVEPFVSFAAAAFVVSRPLVTPAAVRAWWARRCGRPLPPGRADDGRLLGCAVAHRGQAALFVDATLPAAERRVVVAHELGHLLAEYLYPRERVVRRLGLSLLPVLDGDRPPTDAETWAGVLAGVPLGLHAHFLERGYAPDAAADRAERTANDLAFELLAPRTELLADPDAGGGAIPTVESLLAGRYGLPYSWAAGYAARLAAAFDRARPPSRRWGL